MNININVDAGNEDHVKTALSLYKMLDEESEKLIDERQEEMMKMRCHYTKQELKRNEVFFVIDRGSVRMVCAECKQKIDGAEKPDKEEKHPKKKVNVKKLLSEIKKK